ncbi:GSCOCG00012525001-RA-CDS [Cotesia congregata]|nr:GSCOCG00012525001-RA-CDS [Cotesia congregata]
MKFWIFIRIMFNYSNFNRIIFIYTLLFKCKLFIF